MTTERVFDPALDEHLYGYAQAVTDATTLADLRTVMANYQPFAVDAQIVVESMNEDQFQEFRKGHAMEHRRTFAGAEWGNRYGCILLPYPMVKLTLLAGEFHVPESVMYWRICEQNLWDTEVERAKQMGAADAARLAQ